VPRFLVPTMLLLVLIGSAFSQSADRHLNSSQSRVLYTRSAYAHGYMHGYEDGFHNADIDIHMGRGERQISQIKEYRACNGGYRAEFGDHQYFKLGYQQGFREGYADASEGRPFRAVSELRKAADGMDSKAAPAGSARDFDRAFSSGYDNGRQAVLDRPGETADDVYAANICRSKIPSSDAARERDYCDAFARGFSLGLSDGEASRASRHTETARSFQQR
jgi:hypothetical protein